MRKVRAQFDTAGPLIGRPWPLRYRDDDAGLVERLRGLGVRRFSALPYAHRPGIAEYLNGWAADFAAAVPECLSSATLFPEDGVEKYVAARIEDGAEIFKVHVQVGNFDLVDPLLDEAWGLLEDAGTPVVVHVNSGPVGNAHTGPAPMRALIERHPRLVAVIAHMGAPEYRRVPLHRRGLRARAPGHDYGVHRLLRGDGARSRATCCRGWPSWATGSCSARTSRTSRIDYAHQLEALERLGLGDDWLRRVCWGNAATLIG